MSIILKRGKLFLTVAFLLFYQLAFSQTITVGGRVTDSNDQPIPGAFVGIEGQQQGTITDLDGNYSIQLPHSGVSLVFSCFGYVSQTIPVGNRSVISVSLADDFQKLEESVVIGYGTMKRSDLTGAVASVTSEDLSSRPVTGIMEALTGKIAGVEVDAVTKPGDSPSVRIRGERSIKASNNPLYVVDGIPVSSINDIPVSEVQSIEVLKDAVSAAIYGSRGANGVILVTTKAGSMGQKKPSVQYSSFVGLNFVNMPDMMDGDTYIKMRRDIDQWQTYGNEGYATGERRSDDLVFEANELNAVQTGKYTDWKKILYKKQTLSHEHNLSVSTSSNSNTTRMSVGYRNDDGYYINNSSDRFTIALNTQQRVADFLTLKANVRFANRKTYGVDPGTMMGSGDNTYNIFTYINPLLPAYDEDGNLIENVVGTYANPLLDVTEPYVNTKEKQTLSSVFTAELTPFKGFTFTSNLGYNLVHNTTDKFFGTNTAKRYLVREAQGAYAYKGYSRSDDLTWDNIVNYKNNFGKHKIDVTGVVSIQSGIDKSMSGEGTGLPADEIGNWNMSLLEANILCDSGYSKKTIESFIGRFQYSYADKYLFNVSFREDGCSVLADGHKWASFPAVSAAWVLSEEAFMKSDVLTFLKLRASFGRVGNASISSYETFAGLDAANTNFGSYFTTGYTLDGLVNKSLTWEISNTYDVGIDWALWNGRLNGYIDVYNTLTSNLLFSKKLPSHTGSTSIMENIGQTTSRGIEARISSVNVKTRDFSWKTEINFVTSKSYVSELPGGEDMPSSTLFYGYDWDIYYDNVLLGLWQMDEAEEALVYGTYPGYPKYEDINTDDKIGGNEDKKILGQKRPKWTLYLRNSFDYKNIVLAFAINGKFGHMIKMDGAGWKVTCPGSWLSDYWTPTNPDGRYPVFSKANDSIGNVFTMRAGDYIALQEVSLGYSFHTDVIKDFTLSLQASNPCYLWKAAKDVKDPSAPSSDWTAWKTAGVKLDIRF